MTVDIQHIQEFLPCATPPAWVAAASDPVNLPVLLVDHANCEKKAASTALNLIYRYVEHPVLALMQKRGVDYPQLTASRYAGGLRAQVRKQEPARLLDTLLTGAVIEARSCERFAALVPVLDDELAAFYASLLKSESRHYQDYLRLARAQGSAEEVAVRLDRILAVECDLIESGDPDFRFHSGIPA